MFITVTYGADQKEIFNHQCRIVNLVESIKQKCNCGAEVCIDLIDEAGNLVNLGDRQTSSEFASNYLTTRGRYILIQVKRDDFESCKYESLLKNLEKHHPELADRLQKLSNPKVKERNNSALKRMRQSPKIPLSSEGKSAYRKQRKHKV